MTLPRVQTILTGTLVVDNARIAATYNVNFAGIGEAPAQNIDGSVSESVDKLFADIEVNVANGVPQSIRR